MSPSNPISRTLPRLGRLLSRLGTLGLVLLGCYMVAGIGAYLYFDSPAYIPIFLRPLLLPLSAALLLRMGGAWLAHRSPERLAAIRARWWIAGAALLVAAVTYWLLSRPPTWDGGQWHRQESGTEWWLSAIDGTPDGGQLWIVGGSGVVLSSTDRGTTWNTVDTRFARNFTGVVVGSRGQRIWISGWREDLPVNGQETVESVLIRSDDAGATWTRLRPDVEGRIGRIHGTPGGTELWFRSDASTHQRSRDGGDTWTALEVRGQEQPGSLHLDAHDDTLLVRSAGETVLRSTDAGATWSSWTHVWDPFRWGQNRRLYGIHGVAGVDELWMTGHMEILHSDDRGESWDAQSVRCWPVSIAGSADGTTLWAVGDRGTVLYGTRTSDSWEPHVSSTDYDLGDVFVTADGSHAWAVGNGGTIIHVSR